MGHGSFCKHWDTSKRDFNITSCWLLVRLLKIHTLAKNLNLVEMEIKMEIDDDKERVLATNVSGSVSISLHPLVILNIADHWTRLNAEEGKSVITLGALIGKQNGRTIEIMNSFELLFTVGEDNLVDIDRYYYNTKEEQFKQVFCNMDFLGWYLTGTDVEEPTYHDILVHKQIIKIIESPIFLKMNHQGGQTGLPIKVYESIIDMENGISRMMFVELTYILSTEDAERIGIDHVARMSINDTSDNSIVANNLTIQFNAVKMLHSRVKLLLDYLKEVKNSGNMINNDVLRELLSLSYRLPVMESEEFYKDLYTNCNDDALTTYLGVLTKCTNEINNFCTKFNLLYERLGSRKMNSLFN